MNPARRCFTSNPLEFRRTPRDQLWKRICTTSESVLPILSPHADPGFGFSLVRFEAEYPVRGFGIARLTPKYELLPLPWFPKATLDSSIDEEKQVLDSQSQLFPRVFQKQSLSSTAKKREEETFPDEIWDKLPPWVRALYNLKRKAVQDPPTSVGEALRPKLPSSSSGGGLLSVRTETNNKGEKSENKE